MTGETGKYQATTAYSNEVDGVLSTPNIVHKEANDTKLYKFQWENVTKSLDLKSHKL